MLKYSDIYKLTHLILEPKFRGHYLIITRNYRYQYTNEMKLSCTFTKMPCVYMLVLFECIKQNVMVQQSIYSLKTDTFEYHNP